MRILVIEDDRLLGDALQAGLTQRGFAVDWVQDGVQGDAALKAEPYAAVVLDLGLPGLSGLELLRRARAAGNAVPVLILTARDAIDDRVQGLDSGADDYVVKPFDLDEVAARLRALTRRGRGEAAALLRINGVELDPAEHRVSYRGNPVELTAREFALLHELMRNVGRVLSREQLERRLYPWGEEIESNAIEVHVHHLRRRLLVALLTATLLVWAGTLFVSYRDTRHELNELLDAHLAQSTALLIAQLGHEPEEIDTEHASALHRYSRKVAFQVWERGGRLMLHSASAPDQPLSGQHEGFSDSIVAGEGWRVFSAWDARRRFLVQVGERREARDEVNKTIAEHMLRPLLVALPLLGLLIWFGVGAGLRSLRALGHQVAERRPENLAPLEIASAPSEALPLVEELNRLFARVRASLEGERRFTADAAHELRTPLAAIRAQAQVARTAGGDVERDRALARVLEGCDRTAHLVDQLLTLARLEPESMHTRHRNDLRALAAAVVADVAPEATEKDIDLQLADDGAVPAPCEPALVSILMRNLIDNAVRYSPPHSIVRIAVSTTSGGVEFAVIDQGPGIPEPERERVWARFYRGLGTGETGSGLGLSIVKRIADLHGATTATGQGEDGAGLRISVTFPA